MSGRSAEVLPLPRRTPTAVIQDTTVIQVEIQRSDAARMIRARFLIEPHAE